jgi:hypothetical protein
MFGGDDVIGEKDVPGGAGEVAFCFPFPDSAK